MNRAEASKIKFARKNAKRLADAHKMGLEILEWPKKPAEPPPDEEAEQ